MDECLAKCRSRTNFLAPLNHASTPLQQMRKEMFGNGRCNLGPVLNRRELSLMQVVMMQPASV
jgi:hypothetical protein